MEPVINMLLQSNVKKIAGISSGGLKSPTLFYCGFYGFRHIQPRFFSISTGANN